MQTNTKMDFHVDWLEKYLPAGLGSLAYFLYMRVYQRLEWKRGLVALFSGVMVSAYVAPEVATWMPGVRAETVGFLTALLGMKLIEALVGIDLKELVKKKVEG